MQHNAICVTGYHLARGLPCPGSRVTTQRSAVVTRPQSGGKCECNRDIFEARPNASEITTSLLNKKSGSRHDNAVLSVYTGCTFWFFPRPLRQSGNQGTSGSCNRCISESCDPYSMSGSIEAVHLQYQNRHRAVLSSRRPPVFNYEPRARRSLMAFCCAALILNPPQVCPAYFKGGVTTLKGRPCAGTLDCVATVLNGEHPTLPLTRHCQVVLGVVPHGRFARTNLSAPAVRWSETLT